MNINIVSNRLFRVPLELSINKLGVDYAPRWVDIENSGGFSRDIMDAYLWIIEAFSAPFNPSGFHTARIISTKSRCLLFFLYMPADFPKEGPFWCDLFSCNMQDKIKGVLKGPLPNMDLFQDLTDKWPLLGLKMQYHHHSSSGGILVG